MWPWFSILYSLSLKSNASLQLCRLYLLSKNPNIYLYHLNTMSLISVTSFNNLTLNTSSGILFKILNMWHSLHVFAFLSALPSNPSSFSLKCIFSELSYTPQFLLWISTFQGLSAHHSKMEWKHNGLLNHTSCNTALFSRCRKGLEPLPIA